MGGSKSIPYYHKQDPPETINLMHENKPWKRMYENFWHFDIRPLISKTSHHHLSQITIGYGEFVTGFQIRYRINEKIHVDKALGLDAVTDD